MAEYIDREAVLNDLKKHHEIIMNDPTIGNQTKWREALCYNRTLKVLNEEPAADVAEVKHGKLNNIVDFGNGICIGYCSNCGTEHRAINPSVLKLSYRHCRWCGAKMDGKEKGNE